MREQKAEEMFALVEDWRQSGQTQKAFCQERGCPVSRFYYWLKKYRSTVEDAGDFIDVLGTMPAGHGIEIRYPNGITLSLPAGIGMGYLLRLVGMA